MRKSSRRMVTCAVTVLLGTAVPAVGRGSTARPATSRSASQVDPRVPARLRQIFVEQLKVNEKEVTYNARIVEDLGADSLDCAELIMALEEGYKIDIPDEDAEKWIRVGDMVEYLRKRNVIK